MYAQSSAHDLIRTIKTPTVQTNRDSNRSLWALSVIYHNCLIVWITLCYHPYVYNHHCETSLRDSPFSVRLRTWSLATIWVGERRSGLVSPALPLPSLYLFFLLCSCLIYILSFSCSVRVLFISCILVLFLTSLYLVFFVFCSCLLYILSSFLFCSCHLYILSSFLFCSCKSSCWRFMSCSCAVFVLTSLT